MQYQVPLPNGDGIREQKDLPQVTASRIESPDKPLNFRDRYIALLIAIGHPYKFIAQELGLTPAGVGQIARRQSVRDAIASEQSKLFPMLREMAADRVIAQFDEFAPRAAEIVMEIAEDADRDSTRLKAATESLDRSSTGHRQQKDSTPQVVFNLDAEFLSMVSRAASKTNDASLTSALKTLEPISESNNDNSC